MTEPPVRLKVLLREKHWQTYRTFCTQYDRAARTVDPELVGGWPSRAQLHRWLSGEVKGLPYPDHCRVLEKMFPGWTAEQLFERFPPETSDRPAQAPAQPGSTRVGELLGIIEDRLDTPASRESSWGAVQRVPATAGAGLRSVSDVLRDHALGGVSEHARELGQRLLELQQLRRLGDVARVEPARSKEVTCVVERHHDHDEAAQQVDRIDARALYRTRPACRYRHRRAKVAFCSATVCLSLSFVCT